MALRCYPGTDKSVLDIWTRLRNRGCRYARWIAAASATLLSAVNSQFPYIKRGVVVMTWRRKLGTAFSQTNGVRLLLVTSEALVMTSKAARGLGGVLV